MPKNPNQIIGSFILRHEGEGCFTSKYHHQDSPECPFTEACKRMTVEDPDDIFRGTYRTVWVEDGFANEVAELIVDFNQNNRDIYDLTWHRVGNPAHILFWGTAMRFDGLLVGAYWD